MHPDLHKRWRFLIRASESYEQADADWQTGLSKASKLLPGVRKRNFWSIGNPGSPIRKLYDRRDHTLQQLIIAKIKLENARDRLRKKNAVPRKVRLHFLTFKN